MTIVTYGSASSTSHITLCGTVSILQSLVSRFIDARCKLSLSYTNGEVYDPNDKMSAYSIQTNRDLECFCIRARNFPKTNYLKATLCLPSRMISLISLPSFCAFTSRTATLNSINGWEVFQKPNDLLRTPTYALIYFDPSLSVENKVLELIPRNNVEIKVNYYDFPEKIVNFADEVEHSDYSYYSDDSTYDENTEATEQTGSFSTPRKYKCSRTKSHDRYSTPKKIDSYQRRHTEVNEKEIIEMEHNTFDEIIQEPEVVQTHKEEQEKKNEIKEKEQQIIQESQKSNVEGEEEEEYQPISNEENNVDETSHQEDASAEDVPYDEEEDEYYSVSPSHKDEQSELLMDEDEDHDQDSNVFAFLEDSSESEEDLNNKQENNNNNDTTTQKKEIVEKVYEDKIQEYAAQSKPSLYSLDKAKMFSNMYKRVYHEKWKNEVLKKVSNSLRVKGEEIKSRNTQEITFLRDLVDICDQMAIVKKEEEKLQELESSVIDLYSEVKAHRLKRFARTSARGLLRTYQSTNAKQIELESKLRDRRRKLRALELDLQQIFVDRSTINKENKNKRDIIKNYVEKDPPYEEYEEKNKSIQEEIKSLTECKEKLIAQRDKVQAMVEAQRIAIEGKKNKKKKHHSHK